LKRYAIITWRKAMENKLKVGDAVRWKRRGSVVNVCHLHPERVVVRFPNNEVFEVDSDALEKIDFESEPAE
jgi:hypothetical protein